MPRGKDCYSGAELTRGLKPTLRWKDTRSLGSQTQHESVLIADDQLAIHYDWRRGNLSAHADLLHFSTRGQVEDIEKAVERADIDARPGDDRRAVHATTRDEIP